MFFFHTKLLNIDHVYGGQCTCYCSVDGRLNRVIGPVNCVVEDTDGVVGVKVVPLQGLPGVGRVQFSGDTESSSMCLASYHIEKLL